MPSIPRVLHQGLAADKPSADAGVNQGWLYYETDTGTLRQSWNGTWVTLNVTAGSGPIDSVTVPGGGQATIAFAAIPGIYQSLLLIGQCRLTAGGGTADIMCTFNGDTGANYETQQIYASGTGTAGIAAAESIGGNSAQLATVSAAGAPTGWGDIFEVRIPRYAATHFEKRALSRYGVLAGLTGGLHYVASLSAAWRSTSAITDILLTPSAGSFAEGSSVALYGMV